MPETPYRIFHNGCLPGQWGKDCELLELRGFADFGYTNNPDWPVNRENGPNAYNDRANEMMLNQLYLTAERLPQVKDYCGSDFGYRVDAFFGSDRRFTDVISGSGWDNNWGTSKLLWFFDSPGVLPIPDQQADDRRRPLLHPPCGYEVANADGNQFYSHSYAFLFAEPTTLTGAMARTRRLITCRSTAVTTWAGTSSRRSTASRTSSSASTGPARTRTAASS